MTTGKKNICKNIVFLMQLIDMILHVHPEDPQPRLIKQIVESLQKGGIIIYPTDTVGLRYFTAKSRRKNLQD